MNKRAIGNSAWHGGALTVPTAEQAQPSPVNGELEVSIRGNQDVLLQTAELD